MTSENNNFANRTLLGSVFLAFAILAILYFIERNKNIETKIIKNKTEIKTVQSKITVEKTKHESDSKKIIQESEKSVKHSKKLLNEKIIIRDTTYEFMCRYITNYCSERQP